MCTFVPSTVAKSNEVQGRDGDKTLESATTRGHSCVFRESPTLCVESAGQNWHATPIFFRPRLTLNLGDSTDLAAGFACLDELFVCFLGLALCVLSWTGSVSFLDGL